MSSRGAGLSLLVHVAGISALTLVPLLSATETPETADTFQAPILRPMTVALPPAPRQPSRAPKASSQARSAQPAATPFTAPASVPLVIQTGDLLDPGPTSPTDARGTGPGGGVRDGIGGDCALGALCGPGLDPPPQNTVAEIPRVGGLIREPRLLESRAPQYPPVAQAAGVSGKVEIEAHVGKDGRILETQIVTGHDLFNNAALASVRSRRYEPLLLNGVPTDFLVTITVTFNLRR